ncbi:unnamed protein product [Effrenium voratum]|nr:unnamed protein product [Effrenium voratum]
MNELGKNAARDGEGKNVKEWQRELLEQLGAETCAFLRRRGAEKRRAEPQVKPRPKEEELKEPKELKPKPEESVSSVSLEFSMDGVEASLGGLDRSELQKLQWTAPAGEPDLDKVLEDPSLAPEPMAKALQLIRFDFEGAVCPRGGQQVSAQSGAMALAAGMCDLSSTLRPRAGSQGLEVEGAPAVGAAFHRRFCGMTSPSTASAVGVGVVMAAAKVYAVTAGRRPGIYDTWAECHQQVAGFPGARYKGFKDENGAKRFLAQEPAQKVRKDTVDPEWEAEVLAELGEEQRAVAEAVLAGGNVFITGQAGCGKSFLVSRLIKLLQKRKGKEGQAKVVGSNAVWHGKRPWESPEEG